MKETGLDSKCSWKVVAACFVIKFLSFGISEAAGMLMVATMYRYETTREKASLPYTLAFCIRNGMGPFIAYFSYFIGLRRVTFLGCIATSIAIGGCFFAQNILTVTILWGVLFGIGLALETIPLNIIMLEHFKKHTAKALGLSSTGIQCGVFFFSPFIQYLANTFGLSGAFLIISGLTLNSIPAALIILLHEPEDNPQSKEISEITRMESSCFENNEISAPPETRKQEKSDTEVIYTIEKNFPKAFSSTMRTNLGGSQSCTNTYASNTYRLHDKVFCPKDISDTKLYQKYSVGQTTPFPSCDVTQNFHNYANSSLTVENDLIVSKEKLSKEMMREPNISIKCEENVYLPHNFQNKKEHRKSKNVVIRLVSDPIFLLIIVSGGMYYFSFPTFLTIIVDYAIDTGVKKSHAHYVLLWSATSEFIGSVLLGYVTDNGWMSYNGFASLCFVIQLLSMVLIVYCRNYILLALLIILFQFAVAGLTLNYPSVVSESMEKDLQSTAIASMFILAAPLSLGISPLIGYFRDNMGSYDGVFFTLAGTAFLGFLIHLLIPKLQISNKINNKSIE